jgi:hypothetical protein
MTARRNPSTAPINAPEIEVLLNGWTAPPVIRKPQYAIATVQRITRRRFMGGSPLDGQILPQLALARLKIFEVYKKMTIPASVGKKHLREGRTSTLESIRSAPRGLSGMRILAYSV